MTAPPYPTRDQREAVQVVEAVLTLANFVGNLAGTDYAAQGAREAAAVALPVIKDDESYAYAHPETTRGQVERKVRDALVGVIELVLAGQSASRGKLPGE